MTWVKRKGYVMPEYADNSITQPRTPQVSSSSHWVPTIGNEVPPATLQSVHHGEVAFVQPMRAERKRVNGKCG